MLKKMKIIKTIKKEWRDFISGRKKIKKYKNRYYDIKKSRDFWEKATMRWVNRYEDIVEIKLDLLKVKEFCVDKT